MRLRFLLFALLASSTALADAPREVTILYTNDFHSAVDPIPAYWLAGSPKLGGAAQLATLIGQVRAQEPTVFLFDSGDLFTGTLSFHTRGQALMNLWASLGMDAMAIGNHEFDYGSDVFTPLMERAPFPVLAANIYYRGTTRRYSKPWAVLARNGTKIGVIGIIGKDAASVTVPSGIAKLDVTDPLPEVAAAVKELRPRVDLIVVLAHQGKTGPMQSDAEARPEVQRDFAEDIALVGAVPGIDVFVGGHAHRGIERPYVHPKTGTLVVQTYGYGTRLGHLKLWLSEGKLVRHEGELLKVWSDRLAPDPKVTALLDPYRQSAAAAYGGALGRLEQRLVRDYNAESSLGDFIADVMREKAGTQVAFENAGGLRADLPAGPVTKAHILDALPFVNDLVILQMTGKQIRDVIEQGLTLERGLIQVSGLSATYDLERPPGKRLVELRIGERPAPDADTYTVATNSFLGEGGDLYSTFLSATRVSRGALLSDVVAEAVGAKASLPPPPAGRLRPLRPGSPFLAGVETLSQRQRYDKYPSLAFAGDGGLWAAFTSTDGGRDSVVVRRRTAQGWSAEEKLGIGEGLESGAQLVLDGAGTLRGFWHGRRGGVFGVFSRRHTGGSWGPEERLSPRDRDALHPTVARDREGRLWLAWEVAKPGGFEIELRAQNGRGWSEPLGLPSGGTDRRPALAAPPGGGVYLAWDSTRSGNLDVWLLQARSAGALSPRAEGLQQVTADPGIDDSPSLACAKDGTLWLAWNSMRSHAAAPFRADRHSGDAFVRVLRNGAWLAPPGVEAGALPGQVSFGAVDKTPRDAVEPYWHWKQTQNYPRVFLDGLDRAWVVFRTDATGAHNFDLWARAHDGAEWSPELHLTTFSPGRDEFPAVAAARDGSLMLAWEGQRLPEPGREQDYAGGDVDSYDTRAQHNSVMVGRLLAPAAGWSMAQLAPAPPDVATGPDPDPRSKGPEPRTATTADGKWHVYFGDPHSHSILSDAKTGLPDQLLSLSRDRLGLDFAVVSDHSEMGLLQPSEYAELRRTAAAFTEPGRFVSLTGWEWTAGSAYGHRVLLYKDEGSRSVLSSAEPDGDTIEKLYLHAREHHAVMSPHHTGNATWGRWNPQATHDEELEPNFEIASWHGRFEFYGNPREGRRQVPGHQYQDALRLGRHVGVMGASDTHHLSPGEGGLTAVLAERLDRASLFDAIRSRRNYATTGARIVLSFTAAGASMGSIVGGDGAVELEVSIQGTAAIDRAEIVRNLVDTFAAVRLEQAPDGPEGLFMIYEPSDPQGGRRLASADTSRLAFRVTDGARPAGETSYYVRVTQADGEQAWSSPVWVTASGPR